MTVEIFERVTTDHGTYWHRPDRPGRRVYVHSQHFRGYVDDPEGAYWCPTGFATDELIRALTWLGSGRGEVTP